MPYEQTKYMAVKNRKRKVIKSSKIVLRKLLGGYFRHLISWIKEKQTNLASYTTNYQDKLHKYLDQYKNQTYELYEKMSKTLKNRYESVHSKITELWYLNNFVFYHIKKNLRPNDYLSGVQGGKFPALERKVTLLPKSRTGKFFLIFCLFILLFISDTQIKGFLLSRYNINIDGIGSLGNLGASSWQVLATVVAVGLATIGIILQALTQEEKPYRRKLLLHHFFSKQQLDTIIVYSAIAIISTGLILLFKEKLLIYPLVSEKIFFVFLLIIIFMTIFTKLIIDSFNYLFPEKQNMYFDESVAEKLNWLLHENAKGLILIDYLNQQLEDFGFNINYIYDEKDKKNPNTYVIETRQKGSIIDIDIALLKKVSKKMGDKYIGQTKDKQIKAEIYIEYGRNEQREIQPLARIHKENSNNEIINDIKRAIILSDKPAPSLDKDLLEYQEWLWDNLQEQLDKENFALEKDNIRKVYDYFEESIRVFKEYKEKYKIQDNSTIDKPPALVEQLRKQFFVTLDSAYTQKKAIDPLFTLNYFPFALMQRSIQYDRSALYMLMSDMVPWVYKKIAKFDHPRNKDLKENFFLSNLNFGEFYILGGSENFETNFEKRKLYLDGYLRMQITLIKTATKFGDNEAIDNINGTVNELIKQSSYWQKRDVYAELSEEEDKPKTYITQLWKALILGIQSWALSQYEKGNITKEIVTHLFNMYPWSNLYELTSTFSYAVTRELDNIMGWDWWDIEEKSFLDRGGSFGGFEQLLCRGYSLQAIKHIVDKPLEQVQQEKRVIRDGDNYFKLLISDNNSVRNFLNTLDSSGEGYFYLFSGKINSLALMQQNTSKLRAYLDLTISENESTHKNTILQAALDNTKITTFKTQFLTGYNGQTTLRTILQELHNVQVDISTVTKKFYGQHILLDKESFISSSNISYEGVASHYGEQLARIEDFIIAKLMLENKSVKSKKLYNSSNLRKTLDKRIEAINDSEKADTIIYVLGSFSAEERLSNTKEFEWSTEPNRTYTGKYRGIRVYSSNLGEEKGVVIFNTRKSIKFIQRKPDVTKGELIGNDSHISFLIELISDVDANQMIANDVKAGRKPASKERLMLNVRYWSFFGAEIQIVDKTSMYKILLQVDEKSDLLDK